MDFDPSAFLSMAMTEDQSSVYTAPDIPSPAKISAPANIVVEGGLQMEQNMQIPVPMFQLLENETPMEQGDPLEQENQNEDSANGVEDSLAIEIPEISENSSTPQPSPGERTASPSNRKIIQTSYDETRFRRELFGGNFEKVKVFRLHCTICDKHIGCAPWFTERFMRMHKLLNVVVCRKCFEFYGDINFPIEDDSEVYCCWCGEGGDCFCCSKCPKIVCKKCITRNFGPAKVKEIDQNDDWVCFVCNPQDIFPHRALMWGMQRWAKGARQLVAWLPKEEKQAKLSLDTSHCCAKPDESSKAVPLPHKHVLSKIPSIMIAPMYKSEVTKALNRSGPTPNGSSQPYTNNQASQLVPPMVNNMPRFQRIPGPMPPGPNILQHQLSQHQGMAPRPAPGYANGQLVQRGLPTVNRPAPYPMNRAMPPATAPPLHWIPQRPATYRGPPQLYPESRNTLPAAQPRYDISSLESGVRDLKNILRPTLAMLKDFELVKKELSNDLSKLTGYSEKLSLSIKLAICNLAKANTDLIEYQRKIIDNKVSNVVSQIQSEVLGSYPILNGSSTPTKESTNDSGIAGYNLATQDSSPEIIQVQPDIPITTPESSPSRAKRPPATPSSSTGEEVEDLAIAMLCETVLEVGENKENKNVVNKKQVTPMKTPKQVVKPPVKGKPITNFMKKRTLNETQSSKTVFVIDLTEKETEMFDASHWCKKFNIVPCKVVLEKI